MAAPAIGLRPRWAPGPNAQLDWSHPLSTGIRHCWFGDMLSDAVTGNRISRTGTPTRSQTAFGPGWYCTGGASLDSTESYAFTGTANDVTVMLTGRMVSYPGGFVAVIDKGTGSAARDCSVFLDGNVSFQGGWSRNGGSGTLGLTAGTNFVLVAVGTGSTTTWDYYLNGNFKVSAATTSGSAASITSPMVVGRNATTGGNNADCVYSAFHAWNRKLTANEIATLAANPFAMLRS